MWEQSEIGSVECGAEEKAVSRWNCGRLLHLRGKRRKGVSKEDQKEKDKTNKQTKKPGHIMKAKKVKIPLKRNI